MTFSVPCECGNSLTVTVPQAGTDISCRCGRTLRVPLLSQLRRSSGQAAYEAGTIDTINRMINDGDLPAGDYCALSGLPTADSYTLHIRYESKWIKGAGWKRYLFVLFIGLFLPIWALWFLIRKTWRDEEPQEFGRDRSISVPLLVCQEQQEKLRRTRSQFKLRKLLRTVPIYAKLLDEYPNATITT